MKEAFRLFCLLSGVCIGGFSYVVAHQDGWACLWALVPLVFSILWGAMAIEIVRVTPVTLRPNRKDDDE